MVAASVIVVVLLAASTHFSYLRAHQATVQAMVERDEIAYELINDNFLFSQCGRLFEDALGTPTIPETYNDKVPNKTAMLAGVESSRITVRDIVVNYAATSTESHPGGADVRTYKGTLTYVFEHAENAKRTALRPFTVPFVMKAERKNSAGEYIWSGMKCSTETVEVAAEAAQLCNLYGGTMVDGVSCDFSRFTRQHLNWPESAIPVANVKSAGAHRYDLSDILCYLDTLVALIPDQDMSAPGPRNYSRDYYKKTYVTRFCRKPGRVRKTAPGSSNRHSLSVAMAEISQDVRPMFTDIGAFNPSYGAPYVPSTGPASTCPTYKVSTNCEYKVLAGKVQLCTATCSVPKLQSNGCPALAGGYRVCQKI